MQNIFNHEKLYRGEFMDRFATTHITICGAGAIGSNLIDNLARQGFARLRAIDFDRIEETNVNTQTYGRHQAGMLKVTALKNMIFQSVGVQIEDEHKKLDKGNIKKLLRGTDIVVDCFDNSASRKLIYDYCLNPPIDIPCLHVGLANNGFAEIKWNDGYAVPDDSNEVPACDLALARNLILLTVAVATESLIKWITNEEKRSFYITLEDLSVRKVNN